MQVIRLTTDKVTDDHKAFRVLAESEDGTVAVLKSYSTAANDARIFADVLTTTLPEQYACGYPDKIVKGKGEAEAEAEAEGSDE